VSADFLRLFSQRFRQLFDIVLATLRPTGEGLLTTGLIIVLLTVIIFCLTLGVTLTSSVKEFIHRVSGLRVFFHWDFQFKDIFDHKLIE